MADDDQQQNDQQAPASQADSSFPANTPVADMTPEQAANYWKHQARKHEDRVKSYGGYSPEQIAELQDKASQLDALSAAAQTDIERTAAEAAQQARWVAEAELIPRLVAAEFRVAAAGRIETDKLNTILEPLDMSKFLTDDGDVDTDRVHAFIDGIAPDKGTQRLGPSASGAGRRGSYTAGSASVASGREMFESRFKKPASS